MAWVCLFGRWGGRPDWAHRPGRKPPTGAPTAPHGVAGGPGRAGPSWGGRPGRGLTTRGTNRPSAHRQHHPACPAELDTEGRLGLEFNALGREAPVDMQKRHHSAWAGLSGQRQPPGRGLTALGREPAVGAPTAPLGVGRPVRPGWAGNGRSGRGSPPRARAACRRTDSTPWRGPGRPKTAARVRHTAQGTGRMSAYPQLHSEHRRLSPRSRHRRAGGGRGARHRARGSDERLTGAWSDAPQGKTTAPEGGRRPTTPVQRAGDSPTLTRPPAASPTVSAGGSTVPRGCVPGCGGGPGPVPSRRESFAVRCRGPS